MTNSARDSESTQFIKSHKFPKNLTKVSRFVLETHYWALNINCGQQLRSKIVSSEKKLTASKK